MTVTELSEVWTVTDGWDDSIKHGGKETWTYTTAINVTLCGRAAKSRLYRTGDNGTIPIAVTCKTCVRILNKEED